MDFCLQQLLNRQKRSKKKAPVPLTADMLNELNKNHMGGFENYGNEELYIEDTWDDVKPDFKPKVSGFTLSNIKSNPIKVIILLLSHTILQILMSLCVIIWNSFCY